MSKILVYIKKIGLGSLNNTVLSLSSKAIGMVIFLATDIAIARFLSVAEYGEWSFYYAIISMLFWVVWMGINESTKVHVARERDSIGNQNVNIFVGAKVRIIISSLIVFVLVIVCLLMPTKLPIFTKYGYLKGLLVSGCILCFFNSISEFAKCVFIGLIQFKNIFIITLFEFGGNLLFGIMFLVITKSVLGLGWGYVVSACMTALVGTLIIKRYIKKSGITKPDAESEKKIAVAILKYAIPIFILSIGALLLTEMDVLMLGILNSSEETAVYSIAKSLTGKLTHVNLAICTSTMTAFAVMTKEGVPQAKKQFRKIILVDIVLLLVVCVYICIMGSEVVRLLYGIEYSMAGDVLVMLIPYYCGFGLSIFYSALIDYQGQANKRLPSYFTMILLNFVLNYLLIPEYGAKGAAIATSVSIIPYVMGLIYLVRKIFRDIES